jgi:PKD domain-containing protein
LDTGGLDSIFLRSALALVVAVAAWLLTFGAPIAGAAPGSQQIRATAAKPAAAPGAVPARGRHVLPFRVQNRANYEALKRAAIRRAQRSGALPRLAPSSPPRAFVLGGILNAPGLNADDNSAFNDGTPPDTTGAIGPNAYIEFVNTVIAEYDRSTLARIGAPVQGDHFMGVDGDVTFDIQIQWDQEGGRWFYLADDCGTDTMCATANSLVFGWSKTADPAGLDPSQWCHLQLPSGTGPEPGHPPLFDDYPKLGHDDNHLIFGTNVFGGKTGQTFETARVWMVPKPVPGDTSCPASVSATTAGTPAAPLMLPNAHPASTPVPANTADSLASGYVVSADDPTADNAPKNQLMVWHVTNTSPPTLAEDGLMTVPTYNVPAPAAQAGSVLNTLDTLDARLTQAVAATDPSVGQEAVWTQHTIDGPGGRSVDRWYELLPVSLTVRQQGTISNPTDFVFNGAISPTIDGRAAAIDYNVSGTDRNPEIRAQSRESSVPLGQMVGEITLDTSAAADQDFSCEPLFQGPPCRWGDYAGASPDPLDASAVWGSNQTLSPPHPLGISTLPDDPHWRTRNFALSTNASPVASFTVSSNPATVGAPVTFNAGASSDPEGPIADYAWDLDGDGSFETDTGTTPVVTRSYAGPGAVNVALRVTDGDGLTSSTSTLLTVNAAPTTAPPDIRPPILRLSFRKTQKLGSVRRRGVTARARCNEPCTVRFMLQIPRRMARRLHIAARYVAIGKLTKRLAANRTTTIHLKLSRKARKLLAHVRKINLRLTARATDLAGNRGRALVRSVTLMA